VRRVAGMHAQESSRVRLQVARQRKRRFKMRFDITVEVADDSVDYERGRFHIKRGRFVVLHFTEQVQEDRRPCLSESPVNEWTGRGPPVLLNLHFLFCVGRSNHDNSREGTVRDFQTKLPIEEAR